MSIETDIKQTAPFKNPYHRVMVNLMYTSNWVADTQMRVLKPFGLTLQQYNVLRILRGQYPHPVKVSDITERMLDKMSNASRLVDKLVAKKFVLRTECPSDRRAVDVVITDKGLSLLKRLDVHQGDLEESQRAKLTEDEAVYLSQLLDKLRN
ncbi:MarR family winged helix-turn-helix transcriptional regulator [Spirosoma agri]|uniref:MarR family transcriptional regulator n=1 Tax=Spirosoma agri TaxID=1987381 RepID=A0A6M0IIH4_9BACT|nr:MarR family transcriptional regulator [Spirosoma agri]NEU66793.1 MarR family transcriptional regulator [Spirosoma agri]